MPIEGMTGWLVFKKGKISRSSFVLLRHGFAIKKPRFSVGLHFKKKEESLDQTMSRLGLTSSYKKMFTIDTSTKHK